LYNELFENPPEAFDGTLFRIKYFGGEVSLSVLFVPHKSVSDPIKNPIDNLLVGEVPVFDKEPLEYRDGVKEANSEDLVYGLTGIQDPKELRELLESRSQWQINLKETSEEGAALLLGLALDAVVKRNKDLLPRQIRERITQRAGSD